MSASQKQKLRTFFKEKRKELFQQNGVAGQKLTSLFFNAFTLPKNSIVGAYLPIDSEIDVKPLLNALVEKKIPCALPCLTDKGLCYRHWTPEASLVKGKFHTSEPSPDEPIVEPTLLFIPLLAFDRKGHRLGYGKGHYDRFLKNYKGLIIGVAFAGQETPCIPFESHDHPLDYILTEREFFKSHL